MSDYANDVLIGTEELEKQLEDGRIRIIEVDEDVGLYEKGHIPTAISWDWAKDLHDPLRREFIDEEALTELLAKSGVGEDTTIVLYGGNNNWFATYAYWLLRYRGFDNVKVLNGGRKKWELESRQLTSEIGDMPAPDKPARLAGTRKELRALRDQVLASVGLDASAFVDVRSPQEYQGELLAPEHLPQEQAQVPGHIPGAANIVWSQAANEDGTFLDADALKSLYSEKGVTPDKEVISYCRIGERSSHTWFVLHELLGFPKVRNYDGSWTEYGSLVGVPVER
jgi:thiosulfate/3-mercaptopyruvate sulfurtransferase